MKIVFIGPLITLSLSDFSLIFVIGTIPKSQSEKSNLSILYWIICYRITIFSETYPWSLKKNYNKRIISSVVFFIVGFFLIPVSIFSLSGKRIDNFQKYKFQTIITSFSLYSANICWHIYIGLKRITSSIMAAGNVGVTEEWSISCIHWLVITPMEKRKCLKASRFLKSSCELIKYNNFNIWNDPCKITLKIPRQAKCLSWKFEDLIIYLKLAI